MSEEWNGNKIVLTFKVIETDGRYDGYRVKMTDRTVLLHLHWPLLSHGWSQFK